MLHVESLTPSLKPAADIAIFQAPLSRRQPASSPTQLIETSFGAVELEGRDLWREPEDVAIGQLCEAVRLSDLRSKPELKINNISPWVAVGSEESCQVPILQKKILRYLAQACDRLKRPTPECRLDLSRGEYGIRCYLGRTKPTDHVYDEDFVSDSR